MIGPIWKHNTVSLIVQNTGFVINPNWYTNYQENLDCCCCIDCRPADGALLRRLSKFDDDRSVIQVEHCWYSFQWAGRNSDTNQMPHSKTQKVSFQNLFILWLILHHVYINYKASIYLSYPNFLHEGGFQNLINEYLLTYWHKRKFEWIYF